MSDTINVGLLGHGVVGGGVSRTLREKAETIADKTLKIHAIRVSINDVVTRCYIKKISINCYSTQKKVSSIKNKWKLASNI